MFLRALAISLLLSGSVWAAHCGPKSFVALFNRHVVDREVGFSDPERSLKEVVQAALRYLSAQTDLPASAKRVLWKRLVLYINEKGPFVSTQHEGPHGATLFQGGEKLNTPVLAIASDGSVWRGSVPEKLKYREKWNGDFTGFTRLDSP